MLHVLRYCRRQIDKKSENCSNRQYNWFHTPQHTHCICTTISNKHFNQINSVKNNSGTNFSMSNRYFA